MRLLVTLIVVPQIIKELGRSLIDCRGTFLLDSEQKAVSIRNVTRFWLNRDTGQYGLTFMVEDTDATVYINKSNVEGFSFEQIIPLVQSGEWNHDC
jgi:hypothetical protein